MKYLQILMAGFLVVSSTSMVSEAAIPNSSDDVLAGVQSSSVAGPGREPSPTETNDDVQSIIDVMLGYFASVKTANYTAFSRYVSQSLIEETGGETAWKKKLQLSSSYFKEYKVHAIRFFFNRTATKSGFAKLVYQKTGEKKAEDASRDIWYFLTKNNKGTWRIDLFANEFSPDNVEIPETDQLLFQKLIPPSEESTLVFEYLRKEKLPLILDGLRGDLLLTTQEIDDLGFSHLKFQQIFHGLPVWNRELAAHLNRDKKVYRVDENLFPMPGEFDVHPGLAADDLPEMVLKAMAEDAGEWTVIETILIIFIDKQDIPRLAYRVEAVDGMMREFLILDANDGSVVSRISGVQSFQ